MRVFKHYRHCYIHAFNDANEIEGAKGLKGTTTTDNNITMTEFRLFSAYLIIYAKMFEVFSMIDGKSSQVWLRYGDGLRELCGKRTAWQDLPQYRLGWPRPHSSDGLRGGANGLRKARLRRGRRWDWLLVLKISVCLFGVFLVVCCLMLLCIYLYLKLKIVASCHCHRTIIPRTQDPSYSSLKSCCLQRTGYL